MIWTSLDAFKTPLSGDPVIDGLIDAGKVTYNFEIPLDDHIDFSFDTALATPDAANAAELGDLQRQCVRNVLHYVHETTGIKFNEVTAVSPSGADLVFVYASNIGNGDDDQSYRVEDYVQYATVKNADGSIGTFDIRDTIALSSNYEFMQNLQSGGEGYEALLRGVGRALCLHSEENLEGLLDNPDVSVMSRQFGGVNATTYTANDIAALRWLYGTDGLLGAGGLTLGPAGATAGGQSLTDLAGQSAIAAVSV
jgi:hypothetical protein